MNNVLITTPDEFLKFFGNSSKNRPITNSNIVIAPRVFSNRSIREYGFVFSKNDLRRLNITIGDNVTITGVTNNTVRIGQGSALIYLNYNGIKNFMNINGNNTIIRNIIIRTRNPVRANNKRKIRKPLFGQDVKCILINVNVENALLSTGNDGILGRTFSGTIDKCNIRNSTIEDKRNACALFRELDSRSSTFLSNIIIDVDFDGDRFPGRATICNRIRLDNPSINRFSLPLYIVSLRNVGVYINQVPRRGAGLVDTISDNSYVIFSQCFVNAQKTNTPLLINNVTTQPEQTISSFDIFKVGQTLTNDQNIQNNFGFSTAISGDGAISIIGHPSLTNPTCIVYEFDNPTQSWIKLQTLQSELSTNNFGFKIYITKTAEYIAILGQTQTTHVIEFFKFNNSQEQYLKYSSPIIINVPQTSLLSDNTTISLSDNGERFTYGNPEYNDISKFSIGSTPGGVFNFKINKTQNPFIWNPINNIIGTKNNSFFGISHLSGDGEFLVTTSSTPLPQNKIIVRKVEDTGTSIISTINDNNNLSYGVDFNSTGNAFSVISNNIFNNSLSVKVYGFNGVNTIQLGQTIRL